MNAGIIFENEQPPMAAELTEALKEMGLLHTASEALTDEALEALNAYRIANALPELDFADPIALRSLGIACSGDEILTLARYAEAHADTEIGKFDVCRDVLEACKAHGLTVYEYTKMSDTAKVSPESVTAALLAFLY